MRLAQGDLLRIPSGHPFANRYNRGLMARPKKARDVKRSALIRIRATMTEKKQLEEAAAEVGLNISDWIRTKAMGLPPLLRKPNPDREIMIRFMAAFGKVGSNLNQIARQLNRKQGSEEFDVPLTIVMQAVEEVRDVTQQLRILIQHGSYQGRREI